MIDMIEEILKVKKLNKINLDTPNRDILTEKILQMDIDDFVILYNRYNKDCTTYR